MAEEWRISRSSRVCSASGTPIEPDEPFFSALVEDGDAFLRRDFSRAAWPEIDKGGFFSYWKNKGWSGDAAARRRPIDFGRILSFFDDLAGAEEPHRRLFRYVAALILARRRILRLDSAVKTPEGDRLELFDRRDSRTIEITAPEADPAQIRDIQERLNELFDIDEDDAGEA